MTGTIVNTRRDTTLATPRQQTSVSVRRIVLEWSHADETPVSIDEIDTLVRRAATGRFGHS